MTEKYLIAFLVQVRSMRHGYWLRLDRIGIDTSLPQRYKNIPVLHRSSRAAARRPGPTGDTHVQNSYARHLLNGLGRPYAILSGRVHTTSNNRAKVKLITPLYDRWHSSGSGSCLDVGKSENRMMNRNTWKH